MRPAGPFNSIDNGRLYMSLSIAVQVQAYSIPVADTRLYLTAPYLTVSRCATNKASFSRRFRLEKKLMCFVLMDDTLFDASQSAPWIVVRDKTGP